MVDIPPNRHSFSIGLLQGYWACWLCSDLEWGLSGARAIEHFWHRRSREPAGTRVVIITLEHPRHTFVMFFLHERRAWSGWGLGKGTGLKARVLTIIFFFLHARFQTNRRLLVRLVTADTVDQSYLWIFLNSEFDWFSQNLIGNCWLWWIAAGEPLFFFCALWPR